MDPYEIWHWVERVAAILLVLCLCLYLLRCAVAGEFIGIERFGHFVQGLLVYLVS